MDFLKIDGSYGEGGGQIVRPHKRAYVGKGCLTKDISIVY